MLFGINLGGGNLSHESRVEALEGRLEKSRLAKRYGFHSLWSGACYLNNDFHPMLLLSRAAAEAPGLELGMVTLLPLYHPVEAAEQIATLDVISGGKFVLAPALGWRDFQFNAFGIPKGERLSRFREVRGGLAKIGYTHRTVNHGAGVYVRGSCHVNGIEGFWARLKLSIRGTHVHVSAKHLQKYVKEFEYRYNRRKRPASIFGDLVARF